MKYIKTVGLCCVMIISLNAQTQDLNNSKIPPMKDLPKVGEMKSFYQLPEICDYQVFDSLGNFIEKGRSEFIDVTEFEKGNYFIKFLNKTELYRKEN